MCTFLSVAPTVPLWKTETDLLALSLPRLVSCQLRKHFVHIFGLIYTKVARLMCERGGEGGEWKGERGRGGKEGKNVCGSSTRTDSVAVARPVWPRLFFIPVQIILLTINNVALCLYLLSPSLSISSPSPLSLLCLPLLLPGINFPAWFLLLPRVASLIFAQFCLTDSDTSSASPSALSHSFFACLCASTCPACFFSASSLPLPH